MLRIGEQPVLQDLLGAQASRRWISVTSWLMVGQVERFLDRSVAAADHRDFLAAIEEAVAGRASQTPLPFICSSLTRPSHLACAPVAITSASS